MFSGIISAIATIEKSQMRNGSLFLTIRKPRGWRVKPGDSIATDGVCLTAKSVKGNAYTTDLMDETLKKTIFGKKIPKTVNVEKPLGISSLLDGHMVQGHIDTTGKITRIKKIGQSKLIAFSYPKKFSRFVAPKGSIAIDGMSLTVVDANIGACTVSFVDYTLQHTTMGGKNVNDPVNIEFDIIAKYLYTFYKHYKNKPKKR